MPPLQRYEFPDLPATVMKLPPEKDEFVIPGEVTTPDERRDLPRPVVQPPLRSDEMPDGAVKVLRAAPDRVLDEPDWGTAKRAPEIVTGKGKLLRPWDD